MKIVGISGKIGVGKTTVARMLCDMVPTLERAAFSDILTREVAEKYSVPLINFYDAKETPVQPTPERIAVGWPEHMKTQAMAVCDLMQWYGTDVVRAGNPLYWVAAMREHLREIRDGGVTTAVIDDVRFPDEASMVRESGGLLVRIETYPGYSVPADMGALQNETALDGWKDWDRVFRPAYGEQHLREIAEELVIMAGMTRQGTV